MAELTISSDEIRSAIESYTQSYTPETSIEEVGVVTDTSDGIAHVSGLPSAMANELRALWAVARMHHDDAVTFGWELLVKQQQHPDSVEGPRAFAEKREAQWQVDERVE